MPFSLLRSFDVTVPDMKRAVLASMLNRELMRASSDLS